MIWIFLTSGAASFGEDVRRLGWNEAWREQWLDAVLGGIGLVVLLWSLLASPLSPVRKLVPAVRGWSDTPAWSYWLLGVAFVAYGASGFLSPPPEWPAWLYMVLGGIAIGFAIYLRPPGRRPAGPRRHAADS